MTDPTGTVQTQEVTYENINTDAPNELDRPFTVRHEELSCNFYWTSKAGYSLQTTIRGNPTTAAICTTNPSLLSDRIVTPSERLGLS